MGLTADSLEATLKRFFLTCLLLQLSCCGLLLMTLPWWQVGLIALASTSLITLAFIGLTVKMLALFRRSDIQLDALQHQDFSIQVKPVFSAGIAAQFHQQFSALRTALQLHKSYYNQQLFVLYQMVDQLNTPILVFNHKQQLSYANSAFAELFGQPWQTLRTAKPQLLGLCATPEWHFIDADKKQTWQIRLSRFVDQGQANELLIFINIQTALRNKQIEAWQKLTRVLSHEIRNSLTPVAALTQNLQEKITGDREQQALALINERCQHLQDFVSRFAQLQQPLAIRLERISAQIIVSRLAGLFPNAGLHAKGLQLHLWVDPILLQQVLINLIKNSLEAGSPAGTIEIIISQHGHENEIQINDQGQGITNSDNLFVPFYSTKTQGQGIGLSLSRHIIEQMGGQLLLGNRKEGVGACAQIRLPSVA